MSIKTIYLLNIACYNFIVYKIGGFEESTVPSKEAIQCLKFIIHQREDAMAPAKKKTTTKKTAAKKKPAAKKTAKKKKK